MQVQRDSNTDVYVVTRKAAEHVGRVTGYLQSHDVNAMLQDAKRLIRRFPEHSLVAAAAAGLLVGAAIRRR
jgi:ElaB/YqjD/DUF883 family membrane-anchored ribosome-binding protein